MKVTGAVAPTEEDSIHVMADRERLPADILTGVATDIDIRDEFTTRFGKGAAVNVAFSAVESCGMLEADMAEGRAQADAGEAQVQDLDGALGSPAFVGYLNWSAGEDAAPGDPEGVAVVGAVVPLGNAQCAALYLRKAPRAGTRDADQRQLAATAQNSSVLGSWMETSAASPKFLDSSFRLK